jgi:hypothetical protein
MVFAESAYTTCAVVKRYTGLTIDALCSRPRAATRQRHMWHAACSMARLLLGSATDDRWHAAGPGDAAVSPREVNPA